MPDTDSPANKVMATIESVRLGRRKEEGARVFATISFQITSHEELLLLISRNVNNPIELGFGVIQAHLPVLAPGDEVPNPPEMVVEKMSVNGSVAEVRRRKRETDAQELHRFVENEATPGLCGTCHHRPEDEVHDVMRPHPFRQKKGLNLDAASYDEEALACAICGESGFGRPQHGPQPGDIEQTAEALIEQARADDEASRRAPASSEEADQQAEAEASLANRSK